MALVIVRIENQITLLKRRARFLLDLKARTKD